MQAAANGKVVSVLENEETGTTATLDMGNGYQAVYGQLKDVTCLLYTSPSDTGGSDGRKWILQEEGAYCSSGDSRRKKQYQIVDGCQQQPLWFSLCRNRTGGDL